MEEILVVCEELDQSILTGRLSLQFIWQLEASASQKLMIAWNKILEDECY